MLVYPADIRVIFWRRKNPARPQDSILQQGLEPVSGPKSTTSGFGLGNLCRTQQHAMEAASSKESTGSKRRLLCSRQCSVSSCYGPYPACPDPRVLGILARFHTSSHRTVVLGRSRRSVICCYEDQLASYPHSGFHVGSFSFLISSEGPCNLAVFTT